ncbi:hypothetical protein BOTBODRAFT_113153 [Botryobasidium botryosum FD-172 SS1]|uniref:AN1-type domain-containing protein n=1 Tax=Botryobasidium botryosum (strain FD-172 SS1) TaxID=930990 RepID=A0A067M9C3_BOTB1|nr:hypothetical protein BOTBODRAFT_113153 [Botryobasidium botryosum FD-172 SS1]
MDLAPIGAHCSRPLCNDLDLLPIQCPHCRALFCRHHISQESHACSHTVAKNPSDAASWERRAVCTVQGCTKPALDSVVEKSATGESPANSGLCSKCNGSFCVEHRYPDAHECIKSETQSKEQKNPAAHALLAKHFPSSSKSAPSTSKSTKVPTDPAKRARFRALELMKLRGRAVPGDTRDKSGAPPDQRLYVRARSGIGEGTEEKVFWFRKTTSVGRTLDLLTAQLKIYVESVWYFDLAHVGTWLMSYHFYSHCSS